MLGGFLKEKIKIKSPFGEGGCSGTPKLAVSPVSGFGARPLAFDFHRGSLRLQRPAFVFCFFLGGRSWKDPWEWSRHHLVLKSKLREQERTRWLSWLRAKAEIVARAAIVTRDSGILLLREMGVAQDWTGGVTQVLLHRFWSMLPLARVPFGTGLLSGKHLRKKWAVSRKNDGLNCSLRLNKIHPLFWPKNRST